MPEILVEIYECPCTLLFSVDEGKDVNCCPRCQSENLTIVGKGRIEGIVEH